MQEGATNLEVAFPDDSFSDRNPQRDSNSTNSRQKMRHARSNWCLKTVAARGVEMPLAEGTYSLIRGTARTQGAYYETMCITPLPDPGVVTTTRDVFVTTAVNA